MDSAPLVKVTVTFETLDEITTFEMPVCDDVSIATESEYNDPPPDIFFYDPRPFSHELVAERLTFEMRALRDSDGVIRTMRTQGREAVDPVRVIEAVPRVDGN